ncbi:MAG: Hsp70 family protein [Chloroflexota bacterium]
MSTFIGIDLGTTYSAVAFINQEGNPEIIPNAEGNATTPSVIDISEDPPVVGEDAKERQGLGEENVAAFFKRQMGMPNFQLSYGDRTYTPIDLSALVLQQLKQTAETHLGEIVTHAVITVPAYFMQAERAATIEAGKQAGLEVLSIINEPTAAAFAYGLRPTQGKQTLLVYDLGGGTFDVSVVEITADEQRVLGTGGDHNLGGKNWDDVIFNYLCQQFEEEFGVELAGDDFNALLVQSEQVKRSLSTRNAIDVRVQGMGHTGTYAISRELFTDLTKYLTDDTRGITNNVIKDVGLNWQDISQTLLVGGSTRMPMIRDLVKEMSGKPPLTTVNPDEAVALGAAIHAAMEMDALKPADEPMFLLAGRKKSTDVMGHSMGMIAINQDNTAYINSIIIPKNKPIPADETHPYQLRLSRRGDNKLEVFMTQGESSDPILSKYLGKYVFSDIPHIQAAQAIIDITYRYNKNGMVDVSAAERTTSHPLTLTLEPLPEDVPERFAGQPVMEMAREHLSVYLAFDLSGSMTGRPLEEAKKAAHAFVSQCDLTNTSIGLIAFSDRVLVELHKSQNSKEIGNKIDDLTIGRTGGSNLGHPFTKIHELLHSTSGIRYALVLADGRWSHQNRAVEKAKKCHEVGIEVVGIGFGGADKEFLKKISSSDQNSFFVSMNALTETFSTIARELTERSGLLNSK